MNFNASNIHYESAEVDVLLNGSSLQQGSSSNKIHLHSKYEDDKYRENEAKPHDDDDAEVNKLLENEDASRSKDDAEAHDDANHAQISYCRLDDSNSYPINIYLYMKHSSNVFNTLAKLRAKFFKYNPTHLVTFRHSEPITNAIEIQPAIFAQSFNIERFKWENYQKSVWVFLYIPLSREISSVPNKNGIYQKLTFHFSKISQSSTTHHLKTSLTENKGLKTVKTSDPSWHSILPLKL